MKINCQLLKSNLTILTLISVNIISLEMNVMSLIKIVVMWYFYKNFGNKTKDKLTMQIILWVIIDVLMSILDMLVTICVNLKVSLTSRYSTDNLRCIVHTNKKKQKSQRDKL